MIRRLLPISSVILALLTTGCLFRSHKVSNRLSSAVLKTASQAELIDLVNRQAAQIRTLNATVDIRTSVGGQKKGKVTDYTEIRGYILAEKPAMLRMIGLFPVVRNRAFDMVSNGQTFQLYVPTKNKVIEGRNDIIKPNPSQPLENIRPQHIFDALLFREIDPQNEVAVLEGSTEQVTDPKTHKPVEQANYILDVIRKDQQGWYMARKMFFERVDLTPYRQVIYDRQGNIATIADYADFKDHNGASFPNRIEISRPQEEYDIGLSVVSLRLNEPLKPEQFVLNPPAGVQVVHLTDGENGTTQTTEK